MTFATDSRQLHQTSALVELYDFDATSIGGSTYHFTPYYHEDGYITFNGVPYSCFPLGSSGWELTASGTMPRPTLQVSNVTQTFLAAVISLGDLTGMSVRRFFVYDKNLDGQPGADPSATSRVELYFVEQKLEQTNNHITWQLSSPLDRADFIVPARQYLKDNVGGNVYAPGLSRYRGA
jgi:lambda family phage minor tail protein L